MVFAIALVTTCLIATVVMAQQPKARRVRIRVRKDDQRRR